MAGGLDYMTGIMYMIPVKLPVCVLAFPGSPDL
jgi:hypothetical protein